MNITEIRRSASEVAHYRLSSSSEEELRFEILESLATGIRPVLVVGELHSNPRRDECVAIVKAFQSALALRKEAQSALFPEGLGTRELYEKLQSHYGIPVLPLETPLSNAIDGHTVDMKFLASYRLAVLAIRGDIPFDQYSNFSNQTLNPGWTEDQKRDYLVQIEERQVASIRARTEMWLRSGFLPQVPADTVRGLIEAGLSDRGLAFPEGFLEFSEKFLRCLKGFDETDVAGVESGRKAIGIPNETEALSKWPLAKAYSLAGWHEALREPGPAHHFGVSCCLMEATHWTRELMMALSVRDNPFLVPVLQVGAYHADNYLPEFLAFLGFTPFRLLMRSSSQ